MFFFRFLDDAQNTTDAQKYRFRSGSSGAGLPDGGEWAGAVPFAVPSAEGAEPAEDGHRSRRGGFFMRLDMERRGNQRLHGAVFMFRCKRSLSLSLFL